MIRFRPALGVVAALIAATALPAAAQSGTSLPIDPQVVTGTLPNGLRYYVRANAHPAQRAELRLVVNAGSILEDEDQLGLAHFVEHMAFNGTRNFRKQELIDYLASIGMRFGPDLNATTSFDETIYMLLVPTDEPATLRRALQILDDWARGQLLEAEEIDAERGVVIEEWRARRGVGARVFDRVAAALYSDTRYATRHPIGTVESLRSFDHDALRRYYHDWYRPDLMAVVAVGDFAADAMVSGIREVFADMPAPVAPRPREAYTVPKGVGTKYIVMADPEATSTTVEVHFKQPRVVAPTVAGFRRELVASLYTGMLARRLSELAQTGQAPFLTAGSVEIGFGRALDSYMLTASVAAGGIEAGLDALLTEAARVRQHGFQQSELERQKAAVLRRFERAAAERERTPSAALAASYVRHFLEGAAIADPEFEHGLAASLLDGIDLTDVRAFSNELQENAERVVLVVGAEKDGVTLPTEQALARVVAAVAARVVDAYVDAVSDAGLLPSPPPPGRITAERSIPEIGVTEWTLSNGAKVVLKTTDYKADEIVFRAYSPGGYSLLPVAEQKTAQQAPALLAAGGLGPHSSTDLQKLLTGKVASVSAGIGATSETLSGTASPQDLETLMQLIHLRFTAPRLDSAAARAHVNRMRTQLENLGASPIRALSDTLSAVLSQDHERGRPVGAADIDALDWERALQIYRDRFANAGDFTFFFVGSVTADVLRPLAEQYLASLPSSDRRERAADTGIRLPTGTVVRREVRRGIEPQSLLVMAFTGELEYTRERAHLLRSLGQLLDLRLRDVLREKLGATYAPNVGATVNRQPAGEYLVTVQFTAAPERVHELAAVVLDEVDALKQDGVREEDLAKVREMQRREREVTLKQNAYWVSQLGFRYEYGEDPRDILTYEELIGALTPAALHAAAQHYLDVGSYIQVMLLPEQE